MLEILLEILTCFRHVGTIAILLESELLVDTSVYNRLKLTMILLMNELQASLPPVGARLRRLPHQMQVT